jgi:hypothetical protein
MTKSERIVLLIFVVAMAIITAISVWMCIPYMRVD